MVTTQEKIQGANSGAVVNTAATATDAAGDTFVTGSFSGQVNFGGTTLTSSGNMDQQTYIAKYDAAGNLAWVHALAGNAGNSSYSDSGTSIAVSSDGNTIYLGGDYYGTLQLDGSHSISGPSGSNAGYIAQYDGNGNFNWVVNAAGSASGAHASINDLAIDGDGNAYAAASYNSANGGAATVTVTPAGGSAVNLGRTTGDGNVQGAILKLSSAGAVSWVAKTNDVNGTAGGANDIAVDGAGNVYVTGTSYNTQFINADGSVKTTSSGSSGFPGSFVAQLNSAGQYQWVNSIAEPGKYGSYFGYTDVAVDQAGLVVTGAYMDNTVIGGQTLHAHTSTRYSTYVYSASRAFVEQLGSGGNLIWLEAESDNGGVGYDTGTKITVDATGSIVVGGVVNGGGADSFGGKSVGSASGRDSAFIWDLSSDGTTQSAGGFSNGGGNVSVGGLFGKAGGGIGVTLNLNKQTDADPSAGTLNVDTGNVGASPLVLLLGADLNEPASVPSTPDLAPGSDSGGSSTDNITNDTTPTFTGTADDGSTVTLYDTDGTTVLGSATATGGNWSITSAALGQGTHTITAKASNGGASSSASAGLGVMIDTTAPVLTSGSDFTDNSAAPSYFVANSTGYVTVGYSEPVTPLPGTAADFVSDLVLTGTVAIGSVTTAPGIDASHFEYVLSGVTGDGTITFVVPGAHIQDAAGNAAVDYPANVTLYVETTPPTLTITSDAASLGVGQTANITFTFSEDPGASFSWDGSSGDVTVSGGTLSAISGSGLTRTAVFTPDADTNSGTASITVAAGSYTDAAGNSGGAGSTPSLTFDTQAPTLTISSDVPSLTIGETANITFTFSEDPGASFTAGDIVVSGGTLSALSGSGLDRTAVFTPQSGIKSGSASITVTAGSYTDAAGNGGGAGATPSLSFDTYKAPRDFNNDGLSDLLWQYNDSGQAGIWLTPSDSTNGVNLGSPLAADVSVIGTGDFNGDGDADILMQNTTTGRLSDWLVNGTSVTGGGKIGSALPDWKAVGIADFNGDGKSDVLVQNAASGNISIWTVDGHDKLATIKVGSAPGWQVAGTGDFNGDGKTDILLRNTTTNRLTIWLMDGATKLANGGSPGTVPDGWNVVATGDFNGDGKTDIVIQNPTSSNIKIWFMDGATKTSTGTTTKPGAGWIVTGSGDFNGDGISDLAMRDANGHAQVWSMSGATTLSGGLVGSAQGTDFHLISG